jgi:hypothetical protein
MRPRERALGKAVYIIVGVARGKVFSIAEQFVREDEKAGLRRPRCRLRPPERG